MSEFDSLNVPVAGCGNGDFQLEPEPEWKDPYYTVEITKVLDRLKLMSWYRRVFDSSIQDAKAFVDSVPPKVNIDWRNDKFGSYISENIIKTALMDKAECKITYTDSNSYNGVNGSTGLTKFEEFDGGVFPIIRQPARHPDDFRNMINPLRKNLDYNSYYRKTFLIENFDLTLED